MRFTQYVVIVVAVMIAASPALGQEIDWNLNLRLRGEVFDTPSGNAGLDSSYELGLFRLRAGADWKYEGWSLHGVGQIAAMTGIPEQGAFGIGPVYRAANGGERSPAAVDLVELTAGYELGPWKLELGRMGYRDGAEVLTGNARLDGVKGARLAERLIGNWDWVNGGRRFDGVRAGWGNDAAYAEAIWLRPLSGGVNIENAYEQLDGLDLLGISATARYGELLPGAEVRGFFYDYDDDRPGAESAAGAPISIQTIGSHLLAGGDSWDILGWVAIQMGDWGTVDHDATAWILEGSRSFALSGNPTVRLGYSVASGGSGDDHGTFFNMLPTNHKWYGAMDYSAFQNLRDLYLTGAFVVGNGWKVDLELHSFELDDSRDAWYGGSGPFDEERLGYAARRPGTGSFTDDSIGTEIDVRVIVPVSAPFGLSVGASFFDAGSGAEEILREDSSGSWIWAQVIWKI